jgi:hypothetical protein
MLVAVTTEKFLSGASHITTYHIVFEHQSAQGLAGHVFQSGKAFVRHSPSLEAELSYPPADCGS